MKLISTLYACLFTLGIQATDTLKLQQWNLSNDGCIKPIEFRGAQNILHVLRNAQVKPELVARFSTQSRAFHDSIASLRHVVKTTFSLSERQLEAQVVELELNYLQTFTEIWLNRVFIGKTNNAFRTWNFTINRSLLKAKNNELEIIFHPPREQILHSGQLPFFSYPADNQADSIKTAPFIRQPQQEFGWDFAFPEIYTGFRVCPELHFGRITSIRQIAIETLKCDSIDAKLRANVRIRNAGKQVLFLHAKGEFGISEKVKITGEYTPLNFKHTQPELWWPRGFGKRQFYPVTVFISNARNEILDSLTSHYAVRTIKLIQEPDDIGQSFYFEVNGKPNYMQGANVVMPNEAFEGDRKTGLSGKELGFVLQSDMNMLRIWGGGTYLPEAFYHWADTAGVLIWQDLMFACSYYPDNAEFETNLETEIAQQMFRLMHHPSLALICGNNEIDVARKNWGWKDKYSYSERIQLRLDSAYARLFLQRIPAMLQSVSLTANYLPSSPVSNWGKPEEFTRGDNHDWGIWHGELQFDAISQRIPRFMSEYGFPSFPPITVLEKYLGIHAAEIDPSELVLSYKGLKLLRRYLDSKGFPHGTLNQLISSSHELQRWHYRKMKHLLNHSNRHCMGDLWWQLNDVSPVMSWSLLDMDGNVK
jgi:beta-mannosidase